MEIRRFQHYTDTLFPDVLTRIKCEQRLLRTYGTYNAGYISGPEWGYKRPTEELSMQEGRIVALGQECLAKTGKVTMVGLGEMVGFGMNKVANQFRQNIEKGTVRVIVTNLEDDFTIERGIEEAKRRLEIFGSVENYRTLREITPNGSDDMRILTENRPILNTMEEIEFLETNCHLVDYVSGVDIMDVKTKLAQILPQVDVNIIHEHMGAIMHAERRQMALSVIPQILSSQFGILLTRTNIDSGDYSLGYKEVMRAGIKNIGDDAELPGYNIYASHL